MARPNPLQFIQQVRSEAAKVVWPTRRETVVTTIMVFVMASVAAVFFFLVDMAIGFGIDPRVERGRRRFGGRAGASDAALAIARHPL